LEIIKRGEGGKSESLVHFFKLKEKRELKEVELLKEVKFPG
jgi:hypothetical protein